jgi:hypothetical protein
MKEWYPDPKDYRMVNTSMGYIGNLPAHRSILYEYKNDSNNKVMRIMGVSNDTAYRISYYAEPGKFNQYLPIVDHMAESFEPNFVSSENIQPSFVSEITNEVNQGLSTSAPPEVPPLNESATNTKVDKPDSFATQMKFGDKENFFGDMPIYKLQDQNFVVSKNSRICPDQNCKFEFKDTDLVYQPVSNDITLDGTMKLDMGVSTKINKFDARIHPTEAREQDGQKTEIVEGYFGVGKDDDADEFVYNVNGTIESHKGQKTLSLQGVECNGNNNESPDAVDCNY